jgi:flagellar biosynthesis component FlhA
MKVTLTEITKEKILSWAVWVMIIIAIILFLLRIFGNSPTIEQMLLGTILAFIVKLVQDTATVKVEFKHLNEKVCGLEQELKNHKH